MQREIEELNRAVADFKRALRDSLPTVEEMAKALRIVGSVGIRLRDISLFKRKGDQ